MSTERAPRDRRAPIPSSRLTADSNAAQPALASHRASIAHAQAKRAAEAARIALLISAQVTASVDHPPEQQDDDRSEALSLPPITPTTTSRASTIPPADPDDSEDSDHAPTAAEKNKQKQKRI